MIGHTFYRSLWKAIALGFAMTQGLQAYAGVAMDRAAVRDIRAQSTEYPEYAYTKPYCLRYGSGKPDLLIIGDSIADGWSGYLQHEFPDAVIDARVGRQFSRAIPIYAAMRQYPFFRDIRTIVLELGTNGPVTPHQVQRFMTMAGTRQVYWITPSVPRPWQKEVLAVAHTEARTYPNLHIVHWHQAAERQPGWFWTDGVHPNWQGVQHLVGLLKTALPQSMTGYAESRPDNPLLIPDIPENPQATATMQAVTLVVEGGGN